MRTRIHSLWQEASQWTRWYLLGAHARVATGELITVIMGVEGDAWKVLLHDDSEGTAALLGRSVERALTPSTRT